MNVLVVTNMYPTKNRPFYGIFVREQVESLRKEGIFVDVLFINGKESRMNYFTSIITLMKKLRADRYDIIHAHHTYCIYPVKIAKSLIRNKTPLILTFHEGEVYKSKAVRAKNADLVKRLVFSKTIKKYALKMTDLVLSVQEDLVHALEFDGQFRVLPCGVDLDLFKPMNKKSCRERLGLPLDQKIVFFPAARENVNKGFDVVNGALKLLNRSDIHLIAAGDIDHSQMPFHMCASDVVVQLSHYEASPMVLKEAMAANVPVVFSDAGDAGRLARGTKGCHLSKREPNEVAEKIEAAFESDGLSEGRARIIEGKLGLSEIAKKVIAVYEDLLARNNESSARNKAEIMDSKQ